VLAAVLGVITIPLHAFGLRGPWPPAERRHRHTAPARWPAAGRSSCWRSPWRCGVRDLRRGDHPGAAADRARAVHRNRGAGVGPPADRAAVAGGSGTRLSAATSGAHQTAIVLGAGAAASRCSRRCPADRPAHRAAMLVGVTRACSRLLRQPRSPTVGRRTTGAQRAARRADADGDRAGAVGVRGAGRVPRRLPVVFGILPGSPRWARFSHGEHQGADSQTIAAEPSRNPSDTTGAGSIGAARSARTRPRKGPRPPRELAGTRHRESKEDGTGEEHDGHDEEAHPGPAVQPAGPRFACPATETRSGG